MMNVKETLKRLHKKLPNLSLDDLFDVLDCYVEYSNTTIDWLNYKKVPGWEPSKIWYSTDKQNCKKDPEYFTFTTNRTDGKIKYYDGGGSTQLVAEH